MRPQQELEQVVRWYADTIYGRREGPGTLPFYCDPTRVGAFAVKPRALAAGREAALFQLLVTLAMYQSRRDVDIMAIQRAMSRPAARAITSVHRLTVLVQGGRCELLRDADGFDAGCSVYRDLARDRATCDHRPRTPCHVKDASQAIRRMGDMGKLPTSAWLHLRRAGGFGAELERIASTIDAPDRRADAVVAFVARSYRVGVKLATLFVSALTTAALAPGLTPWSPTLDGAHLVVVDANVARVIDLLRPRGPKTYAARARWFRRVASQLDLRRYRRGWPETSPRLVQQAVYWFRSRSNRVAFEDRCASRSGPCAGCVVRLCPFWHKG